MVRCALFLVVATVPLVSCGRSTPPRDRVYTFNRDIAPLVWQQCGGCHRPGEVAPFSLIEFDEVRSRARQIIEERSGA
jgi:hypothetical protein